MEAPNNFDRRGLLDLPITIPLLNSLLNAGGPKPNPTVTPPPQQDPPKPLPTPTPAPDTGNDNSHGGGGGGGDNTPSSNSGSGDNGGNNGGGNNGGGNNGGGNIGGGNNGGGGGNNGSGTTDAQDPNTSPNSPTPTPDPNSPNPNLSNPPNPSPTSGFSPSQPSGKPQGSPVHLSGPNAQNSSHSDSPSDSGGPGIVTFTTISGVRTEITQAPHPHPGTENTGSSSTGGSGSGGGTTNGGGDGSGGGANDSTGGGLSPGVIAAIVIGIVLALVLLVLFLRKRVRKQRESKHRRWLSSRRGTLRSSFGDLRASGFGFSSGHDDTNKNRYSGPFSDTMAAPLPGLASPTSSTPQMTQASRTDITLPAIAVHSTGRRSNRNSEFSIGSAGSGGSDGSEGQWLQMPEVRYGENGELSPTDQHYLPSPISVRPFSPSESWSFPKPPKPRPKTFAHTGDSKVFSSIDPFADPIPQPFQTVMPPAEVVTRTFEPMADDELVVEIGDEVSMLKVFDDGWANVKVIRRNGRPESVQRSEGLIPIDCLRPKGYEKPLLADTDLQYARRTSV